MCCVEIAVAEDQWQLYNWLHLNIRHGHNKRVPEGAWRLKESTSIIDIYLCNWHKSCKGLSVPPKCINREVTVVGTITILVMINHYQYSVEQ